MLPLRGWETQYKDNMAEKTDTLPRILFDSQAFDMQTHGGVSRYISELITHLCGKVVPILRLSETANVYARNANMVGDKDTFQDFCRHKYLPFKRTIFKLAYNCLHRHYKNWDKMPQFNIYEAEKLLKQGNFDLFHPTFYDPYFLKFISDKPYIVTVHDMIVEKYPEYFRKPQKQIRQKWEVISKASHIIAVSQHTKHDLQLIYGIPQERITVIHHGVDQTPQRYTPKRKPVSPYILYVGDRVGQYKKFKDFLQALCPILAKYPQLRLVCVGRPFTQAEQAFFSKINILHKVEATFADSNQKLADLYHYAQAFVYPSEYEGFGIPILEAFKSDCPVVLNNASCFPEIAGDAALYFEFAATKSNTLEHVLDTILTWSPQQKEQHLIRQRQRLSMYSWEKCAQQHAAVYNQVLRATR